MTVIEPIISEIWGDADPGTTQGIAPWTAGNPHTNRPSAGNYANTIGIMGWAFPGFPPPASPNQYNVSQLIAEGVALLSKEAVQLYVGEIQLAGQVDALNAAVAGLSSSVSGIAGGLSSAGNAAVIEGQIGSLQTQINAVASNAWSNLWSLYNNQVVPLINTVATNAFNNLWSLYNNQVVPLTNAVATNAFNNLWSLYNNQVVPLVAHNVAGLQNQINGQGQQIGSLNRTIPTLATTAALTSTATVLEQKVANGVSTARQFTTDAVTQLQTQLQPQINKLATDVETCLDPLCDTVTPNAGQLGRLGGLLKGLEELGLVALLAAYIAEAVADPRAAATQTEDALGWTTGLAADLVDAVA